MRVSKQVPGMLVAVGVFGLFGALLTLGQWTLLARVVNAVFFEHQNLERVSNWLVMIAACMVLRSSLLYWRELVAQRGAIRIKTEVRQQLFASLFTLGPRFTSSERSGDLTTTFVEGVERLEGYFARFLPQGVLTGLVPALVLAYTLWLDPLTGVILLLTGPLIPVFMWLLGTLAQANANRQFLELRRMGAHFLDVLQGLGTLKLFNRSAAQTTFIRLISERFRERTMDVLKVAFLSGFVLELTATISTAIVAVTVGVRLLEGQLGFERALLVLLLAPEFYQPFRQLGLEHHAGMEGSAAAERIFEVLDEAAQIPIQTTVPLEFFAAPQAIKLEFKDLSFSYPASQEPALEGFNLTLEPATRSALVGASGSGKTTLVRLLLRFLEPTNGEVLANGIPIGVLEPGLWRSSVALVSQTPHIFEGTLLENLRLARPEASLEEVWLALENAGARDFVSLMPEGLETRLGENGARLSGGERQRIAIARAFLKNAPILVLDEATSHLDIEGEALMVVALERLMVGRTTLMIAHRLATVISANQILVLEAGRVVERGTHQQLLAQHGAYSRLLGVGDQAREGLEAVLA